MKVIEPSTDLKWGDAEDALRKASLNHMYRFLNWCLKLKYSPDGRRQKGYIKASALKADWKYFRIYYTRVTKHEMCKEMGEVVRTISAVLTNSRGQSFKPGKSDFIWGYSGLSYVYITLLGYLPLTENRQCLTFSLIGSARRTSEADDRTRALVCEKRLGNTFALPEIVYGVSLIFSPHVLLFIILFYVHGFKAPYLTSMEDLRRLLVEGGR
ncbi:hypothetical protein N7507_005027 [Penicillium longicatenatum]|nr:hypothetical protein N7507_005027 [Penicillium longicatenatum]